MSKVSIDKANIFIPFDRLEQGNNWSRGEKSKGDQGWGSLKALARDSTNKSGQWALRNKQSSPRQIRVNVVKTGPVLTGW